MPVIHVSGKLYYIPSEPSTHSLFRSVYKGGRVEIIANDQGNRITPSWVSFNGDERLFVLSLSALLDTTLNTTYFYRIGDSAKNAFHSNPKNTVFDAKRLIGRKMEEKEVKKDLKHLPFAVKDKNGHPSISVKYKGEQREFVGTSYTSS